MYLNLKQIKKHLIIDENFHEDDLYLLDLATVAEDAVALHLDVNLCCLEDESGMLPASIYHAMLLLIGTFYAHRESVSDLNLNEVPHTFTYLIGLYKHYCIK